MGITGLLPFLKSIQRDVHVSSFRGRKAGVDAYCWLHRGAYSCAMQLVMKTESLESLPFIRYCMKRVNLLRQYDVTPVMVFDGGYLPTKSRVEKERREKRDTYRQRGKALLKEGKKSEAFDCFQKCVDVSPEMALAFIKGCRSAGVECVVAPYEADAQLAYLQKEGLVDLVITEDSDMLVFGCKRVLFKMDESGNGKLIELQDLGKANKSLIGFTPDSFRQMCILSGCDYLSSIPGVGLGKASKFMRKFNHNPYKVIKALQYETGKVPKDYEDNFRKAEYTFLYQLVFNPRTQKQVRLNDLPDDVDPNDFEFAGVESSPRKAVHMARGNINPITYEVMDTFSPSKAPPPKSTSSSWHTPVMGGAGRPLPLAGTQTRLRLHSSENSKNQFRPPKRKLPAPTEDASLKDEDLQSMYLTSTISEEPWHPDTATHSSQVGRGRDVSLAGRFRLTSPPHRKPTVVSRFFAMKTPDECTPSEVEPSQQGVVARKLELLADEADGPCLSGPSTVNDMSSPCAEDSETDPLEPSASLGSTDCLPPPHQPPDSHNPAKKRLQFPSTLENKFGFSMAKRSKFEDCVTRETEHCEDSTALTASTTPFESPVRVEHSEPSTPMLDSLQQPSESMPSLSQSENCSKFEDNSECSHAQPIQTGSYMSSEDFIMTAASLEESSSSVVTSDLPDSQIGSSQDSREGEGSETVNMVDLTEDISESLTSEVKQPSMLLSLITSRSSSKRKNRIKVGLQKPGSRSSFKPPRPSSPSMKQSSLASFVYTRRPHMK